MITVLLFALLVVSPEAVESRFIAPCCWRENLTQHQSPEAKAMRAEVEQLVRSGMTEEQIVHKYVAQYGERILREPRGTRFLFLMITPILALIAGAVGVSAWMQRATRTATAAVAAASVVVDEKDLDW